MSIMAAARLLDRVEKGLKIRFLQLLFLYKLELSEGELHLYKCLHWPNLE